MAKEEREAGKHKANEANEAEAQWQTAMEKLGTRVGGDAFDRWFRPANFAGVEDDRVVLELPNEIHQVWIETNYLDELNAVVQEAIPGVREARLRVCEGLPPEHGHGANGAHAVNGTNGSGKASGGGQAVNGSAPKPSSNGHGTHGDDESLETSTLNRRLKASGLNGKFTFDSFVVGANSQFAHAASMAVAERRGVGYNPLFIHGGPGLGKTHLMQAIGRERLLHSTSPKVVYLTCERFTNEFIDAVKRGDLERFRRKYRSAEVMLIDDVQFIAGKDRSQEEFFHTFNTLLDGHCQVVLTSDRPASEIKNLEPRLVSRFECGLTVELQAPAFETRLAILQRKVDEWKVKVDPGVIRFLAERLRSNVRRLEGGLMRVATYCSLAAEPVTAERIEHLLRDLLREENGRKVSIDSIQRKVAEAFDLRLADMTSRRRPASIAFPRQIAMYLSRSLTNASLVEIGEAFGGRDHGTVIHAVKRISGVLETEPNLRDRVQLIETELRR